MDMAPFVRQLAPGMLEAMEKKLKPGEHTVDFSAFMNAATGKPTSDVKVPDPVELVDTDGDKIRFTIEDGKLVEYCNGKLEIPNVEWIKVNEFRGVIFDQGGRFVIREEERESKFRALNRLCQHVGARYFTMGGPRFAHPHHGRHGHGRGRGHGRGHGRGWWRHGRGRHGPHHGGRGRGFGRGCGWKKWHKNKCGWAKHGADWAKQGAEWGKNFGGMMKHFAEQM